MKPLERVDLLEEIASRLQYSYTTTQINALLRGFGVVDGLTEMAQSKRVYAREKLSGLEDAQLLDLARDLEIDVSSLEATPQVPDSPVVDGRTVFVIHGRDERLRSELFSFLRAAGLDPLEWSEAVRLTGKGAPYIGEVLDAAFESAAAVVVLLTPDDIVRLSPDLVGASDGLDEREDRLQARPNVLFEAGMAFGRHPEKTILVSVGNPKAFSDVAGRHTVRMNNSPQQRSELVRRLETAGCQVKAGGRTDWLSVGDFDFQREPANTSTQDSPGQEEHDVDLEVLQVVASAEEVSGEQLAATLEISKVAAEHRLETLHEQGYLYDRLAVGRPVRYLLDGKGKAALVQNGLA